MSINKTSTKPGYVSVVDYLEALTGSEPIYAIWDAIDDTLQTTDTVGFCVEMEDDSLTPTHTLFVRPEGLFVLEGDTLRAYFMGDVSSLFEFDEDITKIITYKSGELTLTPATGGAVRVEIYRHEEFQSERYFIRLRDATPDPIATGVLAAVVQEVPLLGAYNIVFTAYDNSFVLVRSRLNHKSSFSVEVGPGQLESYTADYLGAEVLIPNTSTALASINRLIGQGVLFPLN